MQIHLKSNRWKAGGIIALCFLCFNGLHAQCEQPGQVFAYRGKEPKVQLSEVSIAVTGAPAALSDQFGKFNLQFRFLKPGDRVNVRRIECVGYELLNPEKLDQWYISLKKEPFNIVMCNSAELQKTRNSYRKISTESYTRNLETIESKLARQKEEGSITEAEFLERIEKVEALYEQQLNQIETYIDRFARIDLSCLSKLEEHVIELVQEGKLEEAIELYEKEHLVEKIKQETEDRNKLEEGRRKIQKAIDKKQLAIDSLYATVDRHINLLGMAGGEENYNKMEQLLHDAAYIDTTQVKYLYRLGNYLRDQTEYSRALEVYETVVRNCSASDSLTWINAKLNIAGMHNAMQQPQEADKIFDETEKQIEQLNRSSLDYLETRYALCAQRAGCYFKSKEDSLAEIYFSQMIPLAQQVQELDHQKGKRLMASSHMRTGNYLMGMLRPAEAKPILEEGMRLMADMPNIDNDPELNLASVQGTYAQICLNLGDTLQADIYMKKSLEGQRRRYENNPQGQMKDLAVREFQAALIYLGIKDKKMTLDLFDSAIEHFTQLAERQPKAYSRYLQLIKMYREQTIQSFEQQQ